MSSMSPAGVALAPTGAREASAVGRADAVGAAIDAMAARVDRPLTLEEMGRTAHLSPWYFNRIFRQITGLPPRRFQTAVRMAAAKRLLLTTDISVTDVCGEVGYRSLGTFVTQFRELVGVSPRTLRRLGERAGPVPDAGADAGAGPGAAAVVNGNGVRTSGASVAGTLTAPDDDVPRVIFLGLFPYPSPQGVPPACAILDGPGVYRLGAIPPGRHFVAAAALPCSADLRSYLLPDEASILVAVGSGTVTARPGVTEVRHLRLRPKRQTDPPILLVPHGVMAVAAR
jgi:AraC family transcriptional regulator